MLVCICVCVFVCMCIVGIVSIDTHEKDNTSSRFPTLTAAAASGNIEEIRDMLDKPMTEYFLYWLLGVSEKSGNFECLKYCVTKAVLNAAGFSDYTRTAKMMANVSRQKSLEYLIFLHNLGFNLESVCTVLAAKGSVEAIKYAVDHGAIITSSMCTAAAGGGHLACLQYLQQLGFQLEKQAMLDAAYGGHLNCMIYIHKNNSKLLDNNVANLTARNGHLPCLKFALENGCHKTTTLTTHTHHTNTHT